jgi:hypothetical protein
MHRDPRARFPSVDQFASRIPARDWRITLSSTIHDGLGSLLEKGGPDTPTYEALAESIAALYEALELDQPVMGASATGSW